MKWRPWHRRSGDRPSDLSRPWRKEPRSAAERLLALETKFLLFWAGQERDSVLLRSPAPRSDCSGALRTKPGGGNALAIAYDRHARWQTLPGREGWRKPSCCGHGALPMGGSYHAGAGNGLLDRWKGQTRLADGMVRWTDGRVKPSCRTAWSGWTDGKGSDSPLPGFGRSSGALTRSGSREFKGQPRDARAICSVQPRPAFSSVSRQNPNKRAWWNTRPQPQAPNLLGATGTGPPTGHVSIGIVGKGQTKAGARHGPLGPMEGSNEDWRAASSVGVDGRGQTALSLVLVGDRAL